MTRLREKRRRRNNAGDIDQQIRLGQRLAIAKQICFANGGTWRTHVKETFDLSRERADELIRIGAGLVSVEELRELKRNRKRLSRERSNQINYSKFVFMNCVRTSNEACHKAKSRINGRRYSPKDMVEMREAMVDMIVAWEELFGILI